MYLATCFLTGAAQNGLGGRVRLRGDAQGDADLGGATHFGRAGLHLVTAEVFVAQAFEVAAEFGVGVEFVGHG